jgi:hypothetical protein
MKKLLLSIALLTYFGNAFCQSGGPDAFGYTWRDNTDSLGPVYNWIDITTRPGATQVMGLADDNTSNTYPIGFSFPYYWYNVSDFKIGSNGYLIFNNGAISSPFPAIPSTALPNDFVAAFMSDLNFIGIGNTAQCWMWNDSDSLVVSYINVPFWVNASPPYTGNNTFQIILSRIDSSITFQYDSLLGTSPALSDFMSIGIENVSGSIGLQHSFDSYPLSYYAVKFYYPSSSTFTVRDASTVYNNNPESAALFLTKDGAPFTLNTRVSNTGNQTLDTVPVFMRVVNSSGAIQIQHTDTVYNLAPQQTQDLTAPNQFIPLVADRYSFITTTQLPGDITPANDSRGMELDVVDTTTVLIPLSYTGDVAVPFSDGIAWSGGDAGVGLEFVPPFYPCYIQKMEFFISNNPAVVGFTGLIFADDGAGGPGALLDSVTIDGPSVLTPDAWNTIVLANPLRIDSGTVFVEWLMGGADILIGTDSTQPVCNRSYEILGGWSILRYRETRDPMIRLQISEMAVTGTDNAGLQEFAGQFYPSPSSNQIQIDMRLPEDSKDVRFEFYNMQGQRIDSRLYKKGASSKYVFDVSGYPAGAYICKVTSGNSQLNRKIIISR